MIYLPLILPLLFGIINLFLWRYPRQQRIIALVGTLGLSILALNLLATVHREGILAAQVGSWPAPFGISLVIDTFSAIMLLIASLVSTAVMLFSLSGIDRQRTSFGFYPLVFFLIMGVNGAFTTGDLFNLYVWFEVMLVSSFVLIALGNEREQLEGAIKYVILNLLSSTIFLSAIGLTYHFTGTLNMADLAQRLDLIQPTSLVVMIAMLFLVAFGIKAGLFPLFFWLPASYHTPPVTVTALFSGLLTKVGIYALVRVFTLLFTQNSDYTHTILLVIAGFTMVTGVLGAAAQMEMRRLLSFHIISQIGYLLMGLGLFSQAALAGTIYFMAHVVFAKTALFLVAGMVERVSGTYDLKALGGLYRKYPALASVFAISALSLAGLPPLSGFFAKLILVSAGINLGQALIVFVSLGVSLLTLFSMTKIWLEAFWKEPKNEIPFTKKLPLAMWTPVIGLTFLIILMGIFAGPIYHLADQAAYQLLDKQQYIQVVLRGAP